MKGSLDMKFYNGIKKIVNDAMKQGSDHNREYMLNLHELGDKKPGEDTLQKIIDNVPSSLEDDCLPIYSAAISKQSLHYIPLLVSYLSLAFTHENR